MKKHNGYGYKLKLARINHELSVADLAAQTGLSTSYIYDIESGRTAPSMKSVEKLRHVVGVNFFNVVDTPLSNDEHELVDMWRGNNYAGMLRMIAGAICVNGE